MKRTCLALTLAASCFPALADRYVVVEDVVAITKGDIDGVTARGTPVFGTVSGTTTQTRTISCAQLWAELGQIQNAMENTATGSAQYNALYSRAANYERIHVHQCR